jgi:hypothetical protein
VSSATSRMFRRPFVTTPQARTCGSAYSAAGRSRRRSVSGGVAPRPSSPRAGVRAPARVSEDHRAYDEEAAGRGSGYRSASR